MGICSRRFINHIFIKVPDCFVVAIPNSGGGGVVSFCLIIAISLLTAVRPAILAAAVEYSGKSESTTLGIVFSILDGVGSLGALIAGFAGEIDLSYAYLLAGVLAVASVSFTAMIRFQGSGDPG